MNNKPTIFLDIDGVLVIDEEETRLHYKFKKPFFDINCVNALNEIIKEVNPDIIISSDWNLKLSIDDLNEIFKDFGVNGTITDVTESLWKKKFKKFQDLEICRSEEIMNFVIENELTNWIAVDDLWLQPLIRNFILTNHNTGIAGAKRLIIDTLKSKML